MSPTQAKQVFASLMATARKRPLTAREKSELSSARQYLRRAARPAMNTGRRFGGAHVGYVFYLDDTGKQQQSISPPFREKSKVQRWLRDAQTIIRRTGGRVVQARIDDWHGPTSEANPKTKRRGSARRFVQTRRTRRTATRRSAPRANPGSPIRMGCLVELRYERDHGRKPGFYKHTFKERPEIFYYPATNEIRIKG